MNPGQKMAPGGGGVRLQGTMRCSSFEVPTEVVGRVGPMKRRHMPSKYRSHVWSGYLSLTLLTSGICQEASQEISHMHSDTWS